MAEIYGHKWVSAHGASDINNTWLAGLEDLLPKSIGVGLTACIKRSDPWPPSLPEFRSLCLGLPGESIAIAKAMRGDLDNLSVEIRRLVGTWAMNHGSEREIKEKARAVYMDALNSITNKMLTLSNDIPAL